MEYLLGGADGTLVMADAVPRKENAEPFELPLRNDNMRRVYAYLLTKRVIDKDVLNTFARHGMIYESADYHNAVFVGYDQNGVPRHASYRGTGTESTFRGNKPSSTPEYSFHWNGKSDRLYLFEAPIDMLSYISMHKDGWQQHSYAAACGVSDRVLFQMLKDNPSIKTVCLCLDNDDGGRNLHPKRSLGLVGTKVDNGESNDSQGKGMKKIEHRRAVRGGVRGLFRFGAVITVRDPGDIGGVIIIV